MKIEIAYRVCHNAGKPNVHSHDCWELIFCLRGKGEVVMEGIGHFPFSPGTVIAVPPEVVHYNLADELYRQIAIRTPDRLSVGTNRLSCQDDADATMRTLAEMMCRVFLRADMAGDAAGNTILRSLGDAVFALFRRGAELPGRGADEIERVRSVMLERFADPGFTVADALADVAYSEAHFRKLFRDRIGCPPLSYLTALRVDHACRLLCDAEWAAEPIPAIAEQSGFADERYFSRVFKAHTGKTPRDYRVSGKNNT